MISYILSVSRPIEVALLRPQKWANGIFYGTTFLNWVFEITAAGKLTALANSTQGSGPTGALIQATNGKFYGTASSGGENGGGTVFEMTPGGKATTLHSFCSQSNCADGKTPWAGLIQATDGNLYGTTSAGGANLYGTIFKITTAGKLTTLYSFCSQCRDALTVPRLTRGWFKPPTVPYMGRLILAGPTT